MQRESVIPSGFAPLEDPLLSEDIMDQIFLQQPFGFNDWKKFREVNSVWNWSASRLLSRRSKPLQFCGYRDFAKMEQFTSSLNNTSSHFPCKAVNVSYTILTARAADKRETLLKFFHAIAPSVIHLKIRDLQLGRGPSAPEELQFPNLRSVTVAIGEPPLCYVEKSDQKMRYNFSKNLETVRAILEQADQPEVHLNFSGDNRETYVTAFLHMMEQGMLKLTHLHQHHNPCQFQPFMNTTVCQLKEVKLTLHNVSYRVGFKDLESLLNCHAGTLEILELHLNQNWKQGELQLHIPKLVKLTRLKLSVELEREDFVDCLKSETMIFVEDISYPQNFPKLKSLSLTGAKNFAVPCFIGTEFRRVETVQELALSLHNLNVNATIQQIIQQFPYVRKLALPNRHHVLTPIFRSDGFKLVEELTLLWDLDNKHDSVDVTLLGIDDAVKAQNFVKSLKPGTRAFHESAKSFNPPEFLKRLRVLKIDFGRDLCVYRFDDTYLSDLGCCHVLLKLPGLRDLHLHCEQDRGYLKTTEDVMMKMKKQFNVYIYETLEEMF